MQEIIPSYKPFSLLHFIRGPLLALVVGLGLFYLLMQPPLREFGLMTWLMGITALVSVVMAYGAYRAGWIHRSPRIRWTLMLGYVLSGLLVFINVWVIARLMFANEHDLLLATVLLTFATGIAMSLGFFFSAAITDRIGSINEAAHRLADGRFTTRVEAVGRDEISELAGAFNQMAAELQSSEQKKRELDLLRRDLIAWVSHDLRTPLTSIRAMIEALADGVVEDPDTVQRYLHTAQRDIRALSALIDDLFEMAQMDAGGLRLDIAPGSISDLISDTIESFSELAKRQGVELTGCVDPGTDPLNIDSQRMSRVLTNLTGNALRHTPAGGQVSVCARRTQDGLLVEVQDTGEGIRPEDLPHVFDQFYRGEKSRNRATGGAGLGLAIVRGIIQAHGGTISVESTPGKGTRFYFTIPM